MIDANAVWEFFVRWRTWIVNVLLTAAVALPEILNSPEVLAIVPAEYQRWVLVAAFLVNIWMRPRPAAMAKDPEVQIANQLKTQDPYEHA